jgi:alkylation response protein AidB-like acyl-CoA dehydrogenase
MLYKLLFHQPREMTTEDIERTIAEFCFGTKIALEAGFDGVQLHGSHGCTSNKPDILPSSHGLYRSHYAVHITQGESFSTLVSFHLTSP